jgi:GNAT superfamily N-acetyltransferase
MIKDTNDTSTIQFQFNVPLNTSDIIRVFQSSGIRRPVHDPERIQKMFLNSNLTASAWCGDRLVGLGRCVTDFEYCCYVSDLAVDLKFQKKGIGKTLLKLIKEKVGPKCTVLLHAAPEARAYYPKVGFEPSTDGFVIRREF